ncbi:WD40/YVTN/BNR-like repeat-containing protein [Halocalculus aciditolerans]|uniref:Glycosyl hydrolase n=1 Tax=Halocalculus aciditolerans TaxID=1383812 RepID=A0A830FGW4_9EURY|nr:hypothetical protein [Halocalculus aciditolerans]GGL51596.1 glycosyl hydrolase [Halocalculus aciditolerans]
MPVCYVALSDRVLAVRDDWLATESLTGTSPACLAVHPDNPARALCGTDDGLHETADGGATWTEVRTFEGFSVTAVAYGADGTAWAGTEPSHVYRRRGDEPWTECPGFRDLGSRRDWSFPPRPDTHHVRWLEPDATDPERVYVAVEAGALVHTPDGGETWEDRAPDGPRDAHEVATHPDAPERVYAAAGDGYAESANANRSWEWLESGLDRTYCWSVAVDPGDPDRRVVAAAAGPDAAHRNGGAAVFTRDDGDWERASGLPAAGDLLAPALAAVDDEQFLAATNRGLYESTDGGASWSTRPVSWPSDADTRVRGLAVAPDE